MGYPRVTPATASLVPEISSINIRNVSECFSGGSASNALRAARTPSARSPALTSIRPRCISRCVAKRGNSAGSSLRACSCAATADLSSPTRAASKERNTFMRHHGWSPFAPQGSTHVPGHPKGGRLREQDSASVCPTDLAASLPPIRLKHTERQKDRYPRDYLSRKVRLCTLPVRSGVCDDIPATERAGCAPGRAAARLPPALCGMPHCRFDLRPGRRGTAPHRRGVGGW